MNGLEIIIIWRAMKTNCLESIKWRGVNNDDQITFTDVSATHNALKAWVAREH